jgi:tyrosyl-DNA phosphodiesterase 2
MRISKVFRVHYEHTAMQRDGLFIDIAIKHQIVRVCCTHLESLVADPPLRPKQLAAAAKFMHEADASILGGDLNAIQPFDKHLHTDNNLKDAFLDTGGEEDTDSGMTWGQMASTKERNKFGLSRMDKLMFCGALEIDHFETFGMNVVVDDEQVAKQLVAEEGLEKPWATDHLGVRGDFRVVPSQYAASNL